MKYDITEFEKHPAARKMFETSSIVVYEDQHPVIQGHFQFLPKIDSLQAIDIAFSEALKYGEQERNAGTIQGYTLVLIWELVLVKQYNTLIFIIFLYTNPKMNIFML